MRLFSEPHTLSTMSIVTPDEVGDEDETVVFVRVPLSLPKKFLIDRFTELIGKHHQGKRCRQYARESKAKYKFHGQSNIQGLKTALMVYDYIQANNGKKLWEVGYILSQYKVELLECQKNSRTLSYDLKRKIEATVSRYKQKATTSVINAETCVLP